MMPSPRKSGGTPESVSPRLSRFLSSSVRRRRRSFGSSKKSNNTATASGSSIKTPFNRSSSQSQNMKERDDTRDPGLSLKSSTSSTNHLRQRNRTAGDVSPLRSPETQQLQDYCSNENDAGVENEINDNRYTASSILSQTFGGFLPGTPTSGYKTLPASSSLPDPSPKPRFALSRMKSPRSMKSSDSKKEDTGDLPSTMRSQPSNQSQLRLPEFDRQHEKHLDSAAVGFCTPKSQSNGSSQVKEEKTSTEKRDNRGRKIHHTLDFLSFGHKSRNRNSPSSKSKSKSSTRFKNALEAPSSPLLHQSLSDQIKNPNFASDRSETILFCQDGEDDSMDRFDIGRSGSDRGNQNHSYPTRSTLGGSSRQDSFAQIIGRGRRATELHSLCACMATEDDVLRARSFCTGRSLEDVSKRDYTGETPMHAFSSNKSLAVNVTMYQNQTDFETKDFVALYRQTSFDPEASRQLLVLVEGFLLEALLPSFPGAMLIEDNDGHIPFEKGLLDWIATSQKANTDECNENDYFSAYFSTATRSVSGAVSYAWKSTSTTLFSAVSKMTDSTPQKRSEQDVERGSPAAFHGSLRQVSSKDELTGMTSGSSVTIRKNKLSPHARFCLEMLSLVVDQLEKISEVPSGSLHSHRIQSMDRMCRGVKQLQDMYGPLDLCAQLVEHIASIPGLLETIFYINDDTDMEFALSTSIVSRVLVNKHSVGPWITRMLQNPHRSVSQRAIDYLHVVSKLTSKTDKKQPRSKDNEENSPDDIIDEISRLRDFVPSLLSLGESGIEEVSTTKVVSDVLDKMIAKPFVATVVLCDAIFLALMIFGFRCAVNGMIVGDSLESVLKWIYVANTGIFYFIIGEIGKVVSLFLLSSHSRRYFLSFWNLIDILAVVLATLSSVAMRYQFSFHEDGMESNPLRGLLAVTTGFMWLRVLSFAKSINIQLATFILAILTIAKDVLYFCVILLAVVISFSQMFYTLLAPASCSVSSESQETQMECKYTEYLIQVYIMLLGDFGNTEREAFSTGFSVFLMVLYSFLVTVILLNVLIAIASDSYEKCLLKSQKLFGRARVMLVAELVSFQSLLRRRDPPEDDAPESEAKGEDLVYSEWWTSGSWSLTRRWSRGSVLFFALSLFVICVWTVAELVGFARGDQYVSLFSSLSSVFVNIALYIAALLFLDRSAASARREAEGTREWSNSLQRFVLRVLGVSRDDNKDPRLLRKKRKGREEWHGRVQFLQREMDGIAERQTELINEQSDNFQQMLNQSESRLRGELGAIEERFKETNVSIVSAVEELKALISLGGSSAPGLHSPVPQEVDIDFK